MLRIDRFAMDFDDMIITRPEHQVPLARAAQIPPDVLDRASGSMLGMACGDALGVPYEYGPPPQGDASMLGGGLGDYAPGEWSDDTQMAVCIARVAATGVDLISPGGLDAVAAAFESWLDDQPADIGVQTQTVLERANLLQGRPAPRLIFAARALHKETGRTAGNGALMRTAPVALASLADRWRVAIGARAIAELTHADQLAGDSCVLWSEAVRVATLEGRFDLQSGLDLLPVEQRSTWAERIRVAEEPEAGLGLRDNGYTVTALQAAWHSIRVTEQDGIDASAHIRDALQAAVRIGGDTDTVAAIAGSLLGARWGASAIPGQWAALVHGWPGLRGDDLVDLARRIVLSGEPEIDHQPQ